MAVGYASNAVGTINDVSRVVQLAHRAGALCFVDAVQHAPHRPIDVQALDCDFLACSAYKFFGPHLGILYGKYELLDSLMAYKVRPAGNLPPDKFETGTQSFEAIAGTLGAIEYFAWLGNTFGSEYTTNYQASFSGRALALKQAMVAIEAYELELNHSLLEGFGSIPGLRIRGITSPRRLQQRVPTFSFTLHGWTPKTAVFGNTQRTKSTVREHEMDTESTPRTNHIKRELLRSRGYGAIGTRRERRPGAGWVGTL